MTKRDFLLLSILCHLTPLVASNWIDPDTPKDAYKIRPLAFEDGREFDLVFSDEFAVDGRTFRDGEDPRWTALNKNDFTNNALHYYSHDAVETSGGTLKINLEIEKKNDLYTDKGPETKEFKSGMLQSWNKFCFTGGVVEFDVKMPKSPKIAGLWPAVWMMGNLGRATYVNSTENMWPFSTNVCDKRTKNSQLINSCWDSEKQIGMPRGRGRGAPEVDLLEVMMMDQYFDHPILSTSLQVAPGVPTKERPPLGQEPNENYTWYDPEFGENVTRNTYFYGTVSFPMDETKKPYRTDSLSANIALNDDFYYNFHKFRVEWEPPKEDGFGGYIKWFVDGNLVTAVDGDDLQLTSNTEIPSEPMYLVMNLAVSKDWGFPDAYFLGCPHKCWSCLDPKCACALPKGFCKNLPTTFEIESVRLYQPQNEHGYSLGCSPPNRPTKEFIEAHQDVYKLHNEEAPLKEIEFGGGSCVSNADCGTKARGTCSEDSVCVCQDHWTGPHCLAHYAPLEFETSTDFDAHGNTFEWLVIIALVVGVLFVAQWHITAWEKPEKGMYSKLNNISTHASTEDKLKTTPSAEVSYQNGDYEQP